MILLSIHPEYVDKILSKKKRFEFRKIEPKRFSKDLRIAIYSTRPVCRIVAFVDVCKIHTGAPSTLWRRASKYAGIDKQSYDSYFSGRKQAVAFEISGVHKLVRPLTLKGAGYNSNAPQSFSYLHPSQISRIISAWKRKGSRCAKAKVL